MHVPSSGAHPSGTWSFDVVSLYPQPESACVLLVDDDEFVLRSLRRTLTEKGWDILCVRDPHEALRQIESNPVDVVLSDMQMDTMSGATLLGAVQQRHPDVVRIILSGHSDPRLSIRAVPFVHQFLTKPIDGDVLRWTLRRACGLRKLLTNQAVRTAVGGSNELPAAPTTYLRLLQALRDQNASSSEVAGIVERDVGISARVLQLVSSAFFGMPRRVNTVSGAVAYVGLEALRTLVLSLEIVRMFREGSGVRGFSVDAFQRRGLRTARLAKAIAGSHAGEDAFLAGMLHGVGELVLAARVPDRYSDVIARARTDGRARHVVEAEALGATQMEVGGYLLGLWGLPQRIVEAVTHYHEPWRLDSTRLGIAGAVHVARVLADDPDAPLDPGGSGEMRRLNAPYLDRVRALGSLSSWRSLARSASED